MICDQCKERQASVLVKQHFQGQMIERHLCHVCAAKNTGFELSSEQDPLSINQLLAHWFPGGNTSVNRVKQEETVCPSCSLTFSRFLKLGKFGCATCYEAFAPQLGEVLGRLHNGKTRHEGKVPASFGQTLAIRRQIEELRKQMKHSIEQEEFEEAAKLRDEVKTLTLQLEGGASHDD